MKTLGTLLVIAIVAGASYYYAPESVKNRLLLVSPWYGCKVPFAYSVGSVDPRFDVGTGELDKAIAAAVDSWEREVGADLFELRDSGGIEISLVYDNRQKETEELAMLDGEIGEGKETYDELKASYDKAVREYQTEKTSYDRALAEFEADRDAYDARAKKWNRQGGSAEEYESLERERKALMAQSATLDARREALNTQVAVINAAATKVNAAGRQVNRIVDEYNNTGTTVREEFEAGLYHQGPDGKSITIYQFENQAKLTGVLTHEFGHALSLEHNEDKSSIMYRLHTGANQNVSASDVAAVLEACPHLK